MFKQATKATSQVQPTVATAAVKGEREETLQAEYSSASSVYSWHHFGSLPIQANAAPAVIQPKLTINQPNDPYEQEADRMANRVMNMPDSNMPGQLRSASTIQRKDAAYAAEEKNENTITRKTTGNGGFEASPSLSNQLKQTKGNGTPLSATTRNTMENAFQTDFSRVRVHTDVQAAEMSQGIHARAFTHGQDIYFNRGEFAPETYEGKKLLAHELTHTLQQEGDRVAKAPDKRAKNSETTKETPVKKCINKTEDGKTKDGEIIKRKDGGIELWLFNFHIKDTVPDEILKENKVFIMPKPQEERNTKQKTVWSREVRKDVRDSLEKLAGRNFNKNSNSLYRLMLEKNNDIAIVGTLTQLTNDSLVPFWDNQGVPTTFEIEHSLDYQLAGTKIVDNPLNLILLEQSANRELGNKIKKYRNLRINKVLDYCRNKGESVAQSAKDALEQYTVIIDSKSAKKEFKVKEEKKVKKVKMEEMKKDNPNNPLRGEILNLGNYEVKPGHFLLRSSMTGVHHELSYDKPNLTSGNSTIIIDGNKKDHTIKTMTIEFDIDENLAEKPKKDPVKLTPINEGIDRFRLPDLKDHVRNLFVLKAFSPVNIENYDFDPALNFQAKGRVEPTIKLIESSNIIVIFDGKSIDIGKEFTAKEINIPKPFSVQSVTLGLFVSTQSGILIEGRADFGIDRIGNGYLAGKGKSSGFVLEGEFNFDNKLFSPARVAASYEPGEGKPKQGKFTAEGEIGIPEGKFKGIRSARAKVNYSDNDFSVSGSAQLDIPGLKKSNLDITYQQGELKIGGQLEMGEKVPGLKSATGYVELVKTGEEWKVKASGVAEPDIPGLSSSLNISYEDGLLDINGKASYSQGRLSGEIELGATNREIGPSGVPLKQPAERLNLYGGGKLALELSPWLTATAGVKVLPNGEIEILGRIELPGSVEVFPRKEINQQLFKMPMIEIPLFAIPLGPRSLGLVAQINGGLDFNAGIGPGTIRELFGQVQYNPSRPEKTTLSGGGRFVIPADASLRLHASLGLGLSAAIASLTGGIELDAIAGLKREASASVNLNWNPATGLELNALGEVKASPRFKFDVNLLAKASLDLMVSELSKTWTYNLKSFEWGPGIEFGIIFPIHYKDKEPFKIDFSDIQVIKPDIDIGAIAKGISQDIKDKVF